MTKTVAPNYAKTCFNYDSEIGVWYTNIKQQIMAEGLDRKLSFAITVDDWFDDFLNAVNAITPT